LQLTRLLEQYALEDDADVLASNGIKKYRDLSFIDEDMIEDLTLSPVSKVKLRKLVKALGSPAPEETSESVQEAEDKAPTEEGSGSFSEMYASNAIVQQWFRRGRQISTARTLLHSLRWHQECEKEVLRKAYETSIHEAQQWYEQCSYHSHDKQTTHEDRETEAVRFVGDMTPASLEPCDETWIRPTRLAFRARS
jgi:hypothetical protein